MKTTSIALLFAFLFLVMLETQLVTTVRAETTEGYTSAYSRYFEEEGHLEGVGTHFAITNSRYLNINLTSTEKVCVMLESVPRIVSFILESNSSATSTILTLTGFKPNTTYYRHQDGYLMESFTTNSSGGYTYAQDISENHHIFIQESASTIYIYTNCTVTRDLTEPILVTADNITIDGNGHTLQGPGSGWGFYLSGRKGVTIKNFIVKGWTDGIHMMYSKFNTISNNMLSNNSWAAIQLWVCPYNTLSGNTIKNNGDRGIIMFYSGGTTMRNNSMTGNPLNFGVRGGNLEDYTYDIDTSNTVDSKPIYYLISQSNILIDHSTFPNAGYLALVNSTNVTVRGLTLTRNRDGLTFAHTMNSVIENVNASYNGYGMVLIDSHYNTIRRNIISNNWIGIVLWHDTNWYFPTPSTYNKIYHNNFIDNSENVWSWSTLNSWDNGYPSGGNYWSDYTGSDNYSGVNQNQPGSDGIGDTPYQRVLTARKVYDRYPFMKPLSKISGYVTDEYLRTGLACVALELSTGATVSTRSDGYYEFPIVPIGTYTVTQTLLTGYGTHDALTKSVTLISGQTPTVNFTQFKYVSVHGYIANPIDNTPVSEVRIDVSEGAVGTFVTGSDGLYTFSNLDPSLSYTVTLVPSTLPPNWAPHGPAAITLNNLLASYPSDTQLNFQSYPLPLMVFEKIADNAWVVPGGYITYTVYYDNIGPGPATGVVVTDVLPPLAVYVSATPSPTFIGDGTLTWNIGDVESGGSGTITIVVQSSLLSSIGELKINTATIHYNDYHHNAQTPVSDSAETTVVVSEANYGDVRTVGFWKHQVYLAITGKPGVTVPKSELIVFLKQISVSSRYPLYQSIYIAGDDQWTLLNAYAVLKTPTETGSMKARAEQQLLATWLNLARHAFYSNTQLSSEKYGEYGLTTVREATIHCENILLDSSSSTSDYEKVKTICDNLNNGIGIIW